MSKKSNRSKLKREQPRRDRLCYMQVCYIIPTEHAITRYQERVKMVREDKAENAIIEGVKHSRLIAFANFGGREIRENRGVLYVCELNSNEIHVITVLNSEVDLRFAV